MLKFRELLWFMKWWSVQSLETAHQPVIFQILKKVSVTLAFLIYNILLKTNMIQTFDM